MLRNKQQQSVQRRPLLLQTNNKHNDDLATRDGNETKMTTSSQSLEPRTPPKRRLRLFGGLGGSSHQHHTSSNHHGNSHGGLSYNKQPMTPPPTTIRASSHRRTMDDDISPSSSAIPTKYDTRPIYSAPSSTSEDDEGFEHDYATPTEYEPPPTTQLHQEYHNKSDSHEATAREKAPQHIPTLPSSQRDSKRKPRKADPPTRQEMEAEKAAQKSIKKEPPPKTTTHASSSTEQPPSSNSAPRSQSRSRSNGRAKNKTPPRRPQQQPPAVSSHKRGQAEPPSQETSQPQTTTTTPVKSSTAAATTTTPIPRSARSSTPPRPKSVLRNRSTATTPMVVEEKKTDETERLVTQVAQVVLQQEQQATEQWHSHDPTKSILSRPFGRTTLPVSVGRKFVVEVSSAEWDADEERWKYRILVQQRPNHNNPAGRGSFTTAYTWRSLADFGWLEQALKWEFHGALLVPLLNMAVGVAAVSPTNAVPVEAESLRHWLTDLLNGIRGQGEWLYLESCAARHDIATVLQSEAMETFLYRTGPLTEEQLMTFTLFPGNRRNDSANGIVQRIAKSFEQLGSPLAELCVGPMPQNSAVQYHSSGYPRRSKNRSMLLCASDALASAPSLDVHDSFGAESMRQAHQEHPIVLMHTLLKNYRETALQAMEKCSSLRPAEEALGVAWKRLAIALTNLFAYEKDVESAKLGDLKVKRENVPFRKVQKSHVDDGLRVLSRQKVERCLPAVTAVKDFLSALLADLSAVGPSVEAFREAHAHVQMQQRMGGGASTAGNSAMDESHSRATSSYRRRREWLPKAQSLLSLQRSDTNETAVNMFEERVARNEHALQEALTSLIKHLPVRMARITWRYWQTEISQIAEIHKAASSLRGKINVIKEDSVARMLKRHLEEEKEDKMTEILLIQRMLQIGHKVDSIEEPPEVTRKREHALNIAKERLGRWDIKLGLAVMEAIGIQDPNVRVEETTRDLRLVRKYAIGLRECLNRCVEAVGGVRAALLASEGPCRDLREARHMFFTVLAQLFSGKVVREDMKLPPWNGLAATLKRKVGVAPTADPFQWAAVFSPMQQASRNRLTQNSVGCLAMECMDAKDKNTAWLLTCMSELLNDYQERVQQVESYVYMECVGIQLERHFSEKRAAALAAFEKKTDITTAINVARKKKLPKLVEELQRKIDEIGNEVTQTTVREAKELHLESKQLKTDIHDLAVRRLVRARETSTERAVALMSLWAKEEEISAAAELKAMGEAIAALEKHTGEEDLDAFVEGEAGGEI